MYTIFSWIFSFEIHIILMWRYFENVHMNWLKSVQNFFRKAKSLIDVNFDKWTWSVQWLGGPGMKTLSSTARNVSTCNTIRLYHLWNWGRVVSFDYFLVTKGHTPQPPGGGGTSYEIVLKTLGQGMPIEIRGVVVEKKADVQFRYVILCRLWPVVGASFKDWKHSQLISWGYPLANSMN